MATPSLIPSVSPERLRPMTPVGFQQDPRDRPLGATARLRGRAVVWAGPGYGWQSKASFERLKAQNRLPRPETGQPLGERGRREAAAEANAGPLKPFVQLMNLGRSPDVSGPRAWLGPVNALSRLGNAIGDKIQGKPIDTSDAWVVPDRLLDDPRLSPGRQKQEFYANAMDTVGNDLRDLSRGQVPGSLRDTVAGLGRAVADPRLLVAGEPEKPLAQMTPQQQRNRRAAMEVTPADVAARPVAAELGAQVGAALATFGASTALTGASALLSKAPALARVAKVADATSRGLQWFNPQGATTRVGAMTRLAFGTAAEQGVTSPLTDYQAGGSLANGINDLSVSLGGPRFMPGEIDPKRDDYLSAWIKGATWDQAAALSLVGGLQMFPAIRRASYGEPLLKPADAVDAPAVAAESADGAVAASRSGAPPAAAVADGSPAPAAPDGGASAVPTPQAPPAAGLLGEHWGSKRYDAERAVVTERAQVRQQLVSDGLLEDLGDGQYGLPQPPESLIGDAAGGAPAPGGAAMPEATAPAVAGADQPAAVQVAPGAAQVELPEVNPVEEMVGDVDLRPEADTLALQLRGLSDRQLEDLRDRQLTPEELGIDPAVRQVELDQQAVEALQRQQQVAAELERNQQQQALIPPRITPEGPLVTPGTPMYHGTSRGAAETIQGSGFKPSSNADSVFGEGVYWAPDDRYASGYAIGDGPDDGALLFGPLPEGVNILDIPATGQSTSEWLASKGLTKKGAVRKWAQENGYDGVLFNPQFKAKPKADDPTAGLEVVVFDPNVADNIAGNANAKPIGSYTPSYEELAGGDTRGKNEFFHGAAGEVQLTPGGEFGGSGLNIYGDGFYATDDIRTASSYTKKNRKGKAASGEDATATVYRITEKGPAPVKFFDLDAPVTSAVLKKLRGSAGYDEMRELVDRAIDEAGSEATLGRVFDEMRGFSKSMGIPAYEVQGTWQGLIDQLQGEGYGGFTHQGGNLAGGGKRQHQVRIYWDPANAIDIEKLPAPAPIGPVDMGALQRQLDEANGSLSQVEREKARLALQQQPPDMALGDAIDFTHRDLGAVADQLDGADPQRFLDDQTRAVYIRDLLRTGADRGELQPPFTPLPEGLNLPNDPLLREMQLRDYYTSRDAQAAKAQVDAYKADIGYDELPFEEKKKLGLLGRGFEESAPVDDGIAATEGVPLDPSQPYLRTDRDGNLWESKGEQPPMTPAEKKAMVRQIKELEAAQVQRAARAAEIQSEIEAIKKLASEGGCI